jgi:LacI family transcriptional regulator
MGATLKDVAREACVSMASVSRALNGTGVVREEIREKILAAAARLNYVPNSGAQSLMTRRTRMIGVLLQRFHGEFFSELIRGIDAAARSRGLHLLVSTSHDDAVETREALRAMIGRVDGLLAMLPHIDASFLQQTVGSTLPVVLMSTADVEHVYASVGVDNYGGAYAMVKHLVACGYRSIAHIAGPTTNIDTKERLRGYLDALRKELPGVEPHVITGDFTEESGYKAAEELLSQAERPRAIFAANDMMAIGCMSAVLEAGLDVPKDIAIVGFDDIPTSRFVRPALTTVSVRIADLGARALASLAEAIDHPQTLTSITETLPAEVVVRDSCGGKR